MSTVPPTIYDYLAPKSVRMDLPRKIPPDTAPDGQVEREGSINSGAVSSTIADPIPSHSGDDGVKRQVRTACWR